MNYKILFYVGCVMTVATFISTIVAFFKCNVIEIVCDLLGVKLQKKVKIKRSGKNKKLSTTTVKVKKKDDVKIRSLKEIQEHQNTKSYYVGPRKKKAEKTGRIIVKDEPKKEIQQDTDIIPKDEYIEDTGIMEVSDTNLIEENETAIMNEDTGIVGGEDTCIMDNEENGIEDETSFLEEDEDETSFLEEDDETSLLAEDEDETSLLGIVEEDEDETCILDEEASEVEDGFSEKFIKEFEVIITNSNTVI